MKTLKFVVEKHRDGFVAYPLGLKGAVVGEGDSYASALADARSAAAFHIEGFGKEAFADTLQSRALATFRDTLLPKVLSEKLPVTGE